MLANGALNMIRVDYMNILLLYIRLITGFLSRTADGTATILKWGCPLVIFGKSSFARNLMYWCWPNGGLANSFKCLFVAPSR